MNSLVQYQAYAETALASYAKSLSLGTGVNRQNWIDAEMTAPQAAKFDSRWTVLSQSDETTWNLVGFSAVLLKDVQTGDKVLAIRGTDGGADFLTDVINITLLGSVLAMPQYNAVEAYYQQLISSGKITASETFIVTGHSLGGFLAQAFTARHSTAVSAAYTFNAPGFGGILTQLGNFLGIPENTSSHSKIVNLHATDGASMTAGLGVMLGATQKVRIENGSLIQNHSIVTLTDALAFQSAYAQLQPPLTTAQASSLFAAAGSGDRRLEGSLDALRRTSLGTGVASTPTGDREAVYAALQSLTAKNDQGQYSNATFAALAGKVTLTPAAQASVLQATAKTDFGAFLSLQFLSPVVISTTDAGALAALKAVHGQTATDWQADANARLYGDTDYALTFTDQWCEDRATLLAALTKVNEKDLSAPWLTDASAPADRSLVFHYSVPGSGSILSLGLSRDNAPRAPQEIYFGTELAETLSGTDNSKYGDRLYGGGGADSIFGQKGNDYLEGNAGDDTLNGGDGFDTLLGGLGFDTYVLDASDGAASMDTLRDADGSGAVRVRDAMGSAVVLDGGRKVADSTWLSTDGRFTYSLANEGTPQQTLTVRGAGVQARIVGWTELLSLGIQLQDATPLQEPAGSRTIMGDLYVEPGSDKDELGNWVTTGAPDPGRLDVLYDSADADIMRSGEGVDLIYASRGGDNWIEAGAGRDWVGAGSGDDTLWGSEPATLDLITAQTLGAGDGEADMLAGGGGSDMVMGGASNDALLGEDGADTLIGGAGDDNIFGDRWMPTTQVAFWNWQRESTTGTDGRLERRLAGFGVEGFDDEPFGMDQQADFILGGAGDDWIFGDGADDILDGGIGADLVYGGAGADVVDGGDGDDELHGDGSGTAPSTLDWASFDAHGNDVMDGGAGHDYIAGGGGHDVLAGGDGDDEINGDAGDLPLEQHGDDVLDGGLGDDRLWGNGGHDTLYGSDGNDQLVGEAGRDQLDGGAGHDVLVGDGADTAAALHDDDGLIGGEGDDSLVGGGGADRLDGGSGDDALMGDDAAIDPALHGADVLVGGDGADHLDGMGGDDWLDGGEGADLLLGGAGADTLIGGAGLDEVDGGAGDDAYIVTAGDTGSLSLGLVERVGDEEGKNRIVFSGGFDLESMRLYPNGSTSTWLAVQGDHAVAIAGLWGEGGTTMEFGGVAGTEDGSLTVSAQEFFGATWNQVVWASTSLDAAQLIGGRLDDQLSATGNGATLWGGRGDDMLLASGGSNTFNYRAGDSHDAIADTSPLTDAQGAPQHSTLRFGAGVVSSNITLSHDAGWLVLDIDGGGSIAISGFDRHDALAPGAVDRFVFADGAELSRSELLARGFDIAGTSGMDVLLGTNLVDRLKAGAGGDSASGGAGADIYGFDLGDGHDVFADGDAEAGGDDSLVFGAGVYPETVAARRVDDDLVLLAGADDSVTLRAYFSAGRDTIEQILFADGTRWGSADVSARLLLGTSGDDTILGGDGADTLTSQAGSDSMEGGLGDDTYRVELGDGHDVVFDTGGTDRVAFGTGIDSSALSFTLQGGDLLVRVSADDRLTVAAYVATDPNAHLIERFEFADGSAMTRADVYSQLLRATEGDDEIYGFAGDDVIDGLGGNDSIDGGAGNDILSGGAGQDFVNGGSGNDTVDGGGGSDSLYGGPGSDVYLVGVHGGGAASSYVTIDEQTGGDASDIDLVHLGTGTTPSTVRFRAATYAADLVIVPNPGQVVVVRGQFAADGPSNQIERFEFGDGTVWTAQQAKEAALLGAPNSELIRGSASSDHITGGYGHDTLRGEGGDDTLEGDEGNDMLEGAAGHDALYGGVGDDALAGGDGNDQIVGGAGLDQLDGGAGDDVYHFGLGSGHDIVTQDAAGLDEVRLAGGITVAQVKLHRVSSPASPDLPFVGDSLAIQLADGGDQLWIANYFAAGTAGHVETITFVDGTRWDHAAVNARVSSPGGTASVLTGTKRADTFVIDHWDDVLPTPTAGDQALSSVSYRLSGAALAGFTMTGGLNLFAMDNRGSSRIRGNAGDNFFESSAIMSGALYEGGAGNDQYVSTRSIDSVNPGQDPAELSMAISELAGEGTDTYRSGFWSVKLPSHVENLILLDPNPTQSGRWSYYAEGPNDYSHRFIGNDQVNTIDSTLYEDGARHSWWASSSGLLSSSRVVRLDGGAGADTLIGGVLDNVYVVHEAGDMFVETGVDWSGADLSKDTIETPFATTLEAWPHIENIRLSGLAPVSATGDAKANQLDGSLNSAANVLSGAAGDDTYVVGVGDVVFERAGEGHDTVVVAAWAASTVRVTDFNQIEALRLGPNAGDLALEGSAGADSLVGSWGNNRIAGGDGNDYLADQHVNDSASYYYGSPWRDADLLEGGAGDDDFFSYRGIDVLDGGAGNDSLAIERGWSRQANVRFGLGDGQDTLYSTGYGSDPTSLVLELRAGVELVDLAILELGGHIALTLADGSALNMHDTSHRGTASAFRLTSLVLADGVHVSGDAMIDALARTTDRRTPTPQADVLAGTDQADVVNADSGDDLVTAGAGDDLLRGGAGNDALYGGAGADTLHGDVGNDLLAGGYGPDVYRYSRGFGNDVIDDMLGTGANGGSDDGAADRLEFDATVAVADLAVYARMEGSVPVGLVLALPATGDSIDLNRSYDSAAPGAVELVRFSDGTQWDLSALRSKVSGQVGSSLADTLSGTSGADMLDGRGGADTMTGLAGDDTYGVDSTGDTVIEAANAGTDTIMSSISYLLGANVERLWLTGDSAIDGYGNGLANVLSGNAAANRLDGGAGADAMSGGAGNDTYVVDSTGDSIIEQAGDGMDTVETALAWTLAANLENLTLKGGAKVKGTGNALDNRIVGNGAANTLTGHAGNDTLDGGAGADILVGGTGADGYVFGRGYGVDTVQENDTTAGVVDRVLFAAGIAQPDVAYQRNGNNLEVLIRGTSDKLVLSNWYLGAQYQVEQFAYADGSTVGGAHVASLISAMATFDAPPNPSTSSPIMSPAPWRVPDLTVAMM